MNYLKPLIHSGTKAIIKVIRYSVIDGHTNESKYAYSQISQGGIENMKYLLLIFFGPLITLNIIE